MIFWFSATGNSHYVAQRLAVFTGDEMVSITAALQVGKKHFSLDDAQERVGFVIPTFAYSLPGIVARFIEQTTFDVPDGCYVYAVFTCGERSGGEMVALQNALAQKDIKLDAAFELVMPDNFIFWTPLPSDDVLTAKLDAADARLEECAQVIIARQAQLLVATQPEFPFMPMSVISTAAGTAKFSATQKCTGCGTCVKVCPLKTIALDAASHPVWEGECTMCLACLHRCPAAAIEHANDTQGKRRYLNPRLGSVVLP
ncbi:MAG: 4Fe-4S dicluster domain-containing protein [Coriobacteriales bacterium]|jgi:ferredoxin/flavodoxin|nr:4Fe-4S dicluster domain-containing protein [Coriobacteriales bacterium]